MLNVNHRLTAAGAGHDTVPRDRASAGLRRTMGALLAALIGIATVVVPSAVAQAATPVTANRDFNLRSTTDVSADWVGEVRAGQSLSEVCVVPGTGWHLVYRSASNARDWVTGFAPGTHLTRGPSTPPAPTCAWADDHFALNTTLRRGPRLDAVRHGGERTNEPVRAMCFLFSEGEFWDLVWLTGTRYGIGWTPTHRLANNGTPTAC